MTTAKQNWQNWSENWDSSLKMWRKATPLSTTRTTKCTNTSLSCLKVKCRFLTLVTKPQSFGSTAHKISQASTSKRTLLQIWEWTTNQSSGNQNTSISNLTLSPRWTLRKNVNESISLRWWAPREMLNLHKSTTGKSGKVSKEKSVPWELRMMSWKELCCMNDWHENDSFWYDFLSVFVQCTNSFNNFYEKYQISLGTSNLLKRFKCRKI